MKKIETYGGGGDGFFVGVLVCVAWGWLCWLRSCDILSKNSWSYMSSVFF